MDILSWSRHAQERKFLASKLGGIFPKRSPNGGPSVAGYSANPIDPLGGSPAKKYGKKKKIGIYSFLSSWQ